MANSYIGSASPQLICSPPFPLRGSITRCIPSLSPST